MLLRAAQACLFPSPACLPAFTPLTHLVVHALQKIAQLALWASRRHGDERRDHHAGVAVLVAGGGPAAAAAVEPAHEAAQRARVPAMPHLGTGAPRARFEPLRGARAAQQGKALFCLFWHLQAELFPCIAEQVAEPGSARRHVVPARCCWVHEAVAGACCLCIWCR